MIAPLLYTVNGPPVPWSRARVVTAPGKPPRFVTAKRLREYKRLVFGLAMAARMAWQLRHGQWPTAAHYRVSGVFYLPTKRFPDADNLIKAHLDGAQGQLWINDVRCEIGGVVRVYRKGDGAAEIRVEVIA